MKLNTAFVTFFPSCGCSVTFHDAIQRIGSGTIAPHSGGSDSRHKPRMPASAPAKVATSAGSLPVVDFGRPSRPVT